MPENQNSSQPKRKRTSKQSQRKVRQGNLSLIDDVVSRGMVTLVELSGLFGKSTRKIQQQLRKLQKKKFLLGWFSEKYRRCSSVGMVLISFNTKTYQISFIYC